MSSVKRHYDDLLAAHYSWMSGMSVADKAAQERLLLETLDADGLRTGLAVDLGCGPGYQSIALADLGYAPVLAIDSCESLLRELEQAKGGRPIDGTLADLSGFRGLVSDGSVSLIACMGDTLPHLPSRADVSKLFRDAFASLHEGGRLVLTLRDLSRELVGLDRFIPVRADLDRIMMCSLDFGPDTVTVNDLVHVRQENHWSLHKSSYQKLRLAPAELVAELARCGFVVDHDAAGPRFHAISARKPETTRP
jgi:SAM-dependent methyltransferase